MSEDKTELAEEVERRITKYTLKAKNFTEDELNKVDEFCKLHFGNDRKKMILTLITLFEDDTKINVLNEKINGLQDYITAVADDLYAQIDKIKKEETQQENERPSFKGFSRGD